MKGIGVVIVRLPLSTIGSAEENEEDQSMRWPDTSRRRG